METLAVLISMVSLFWPVLMETLHSNSRNSTAAKAAAFQSPHLLGLPNEVHCRIGQFLTPMPRAYLALSCKQLYAIHYEAIKSPDLEFPYTFQPPKGFRTREQQFRAERWKFLKGLETAQWKCCSQCMKLHPVREFSIRNQARHPDKRICKLGKNSGIVELCPCVRLTHHGRMKMIETLLCDTNRARYLGELDFSPNSPHLWHRCVTPGNISCGESVTTRLFPLIAEGRLFVLTVYNISYDPDSIRAWIPPPTRLLCPHLALNTYINGLDEAQKNPTPSFVVPYNIARTRLYCSWCWTDIGDYTCGQDGSRSLATCRDLGFADSGPDPQHSWFEQTVYSQDPPQDRDQLDRSPYWGLARFRKDLFPGATLNQLRGG